jgi:M6 family metalloprotease-like protein
VDFIDVQMATETKERVKDLWFSTNRKVPSGSVNEYFSEVSNGAVDFSGEVVGPFTLNHNQSYYSNHRENSPSIHFSVGILKFTRQWPWLARTKHSDYG